MRIAVHYVARDDVPQGVWWVGIEGIRHYYVPNSPIEALGRYTMYKKVQGEWEDYFSRLADYTPVEDDWDVVEISDAITPREYLEMARSMSRSGM